MPLFVDRALETSTTTGTGDITLAGQVLGYTTLANSHVVGELISYGIEGIDANNNPSGEWELGFGKLTSSTVLSRLLPIRSSNSNNAVTFSAGTKRVWSNANAFLLQDEFSTAACGIWSPPGHNSSSTPSQFGLPAFTAGTAGIAIGIFTTNRLTRMNRIRFQTTATAGTINFIRQAVMTKTIGDGSAGGFVMRMKFGISDAATVAGARFFAGMSSSTSAPTNVEPSTLTNQIGVAQLSTGNNLQLVYGGSSAQTAVDLGANFPANTLGVDLYDFQLIAPRSKANQVLYGIERVGSGFAASGLLPNATPGTTLPSNTTLMDPMIWRTNNATALQAQFDVGTILLYSDH
jgi:hypothetical protein